MFIEVKNLSKIYNDYLAVNQINFEIEKINSWTAGTKRMWKTTQ